MSVVAVIHSLKKTILQVELITPSCIGKHNVLVSECQVLAQMVFKVFMQKSFFLS